VHFLALLAIAHDTVELMRNAVVTRGVDLVVVSHGALQLLGMDVASLLLVGRVHLATL
jgi:hypothetical protein